MKTLHIFLLTTALSVPVFVDPGIALPPVLNQSGNYSLQQNQEQIQVKNPLGIEQRVDIFSRIPFVVLRFDGNDYKAWSIETTSVSLRMKPSETLILDFSTTNTKNNLSISFSN